MAEEREHAEITFTPIIYVRAEKVAGVLGCSIEHADKLLSQPDTKTLLQTALAQAFHKAVDDVIYQMLRSAQVRLPDIRRDVVVELPILPGMQGLIG